VLPLPCATVQHNRSHNCNPGKLNVSASWCRVQDAASKSRPGSSSMLSISALALVSPSQVLPLPCATVQHNRSHNCTSQGRSMSQQVGSEGPKTLASKSRPGSSSILSISALASGELSSTPMPFFCSCTAYGQQAVQSSESQLLHLISKHPGATKARVRR